MKTITYWLIMLPIETITLKLINVPDWMKEELALCIEKQFFVKEEK